ncbi:hypothetical protein [Pengzhenrongella frigida]|uniref:Uncharacterized protein n=1 Tax=Pengzhenrongella frigida TaxID=1259133 RepID=A0A4V1ZGX8_9MICO|nr:hypothetical protein [Cellulomonas sp. HLT2-17]RYV50094.1 hypothetical protein EUA98_15340 [Cellulomonas sp. HLT2-17]
MTDQTAASRARGQMPSAQGLVEVYLGQLEGAESTVRQRRWALRDLLAFVAEQGEPAHLTGRMLLDPELLTAWVTRAANDPDAPASQAGLRARAGAARALDGFARAQNLLGPDVHAPAPLTLAAPPGPAKTDRSAARHLLTVAAGAAPWPVHPGVWARFAAHAHLAAVTGSGEGALAALTVHDLTATGSLPGVELDDRARLTVARWVGVRTALVADLQGSDPGALWLRVHPSTNPRTGKIAPAGLAITARGLRMAFTHMVAAAAAVDDRVATVRPRDLRALGREPV